MLTTHTHGTAENARLCLHIYSRRREQIAPVVLVLTAADAATLAQAVQDAVQPLRPVTRTDHPCCPRCQASELLAYGARSVEGTLVVRDATCLICGTGWHDVYTYSGSVMCDA